MNTYDVVYNTLKKSKLRLKTSRGHDELVELGKLRRFAAVDSRPAQVQRLEVILLLIKVGFGRTYILY
jgi:hypothetical protein